MRAFALGVGGVALKPRAFARLMLCAGAAVASLLALDNLLYLLSPVLPSRFVARMSPYSRIRHHDANEERSDWLYVGNIKVGKARRQTDVAVDSATAMAA